MIVRCLYSNRELGDLSNTFWSTLSMYDQNLTAANFQGSPRNQTYIGKHFRARLFVSEALPAGHGYYWPGAIDIMPLTPEAELWLLANMPPSAKILET